MNIHYSGFMTSKSTVWPNCGGGVVACRNLTEVEENKNKNLEKNVKNLTLCYIAQTSFSFFLSV